MILYSKSGEFLGIGKEELSFLGYEDLDEFKTVNDDVADLFVNRPGYIFKFKNFSWIDYALHSGAPKKSVILKLKTGNEVETAIKIKELFLNNPKENEDIYYSIEFTNIVTQTNSVQAEAFVQTNSTPSFNPPETFKEEEIKPEIIMPSLENDFEKEIKPKIVMPTLENDFEEEDKDNKEIDLASDFQQINTEEDTTFKLKLNDESLIEEAIKPEISIKENFAEDYVKEENIEIGSKEKDLPVLEAKTIPVAIDESFKIDIKDEQEEIAQFDLFKCVEELGLDIGLVSELITDYITKLDNTVPQIKSAIIENDEKQLKELIYKLKGISDNLNINHISSKLVDILNATNKESKNEEIAKFEKIVTKFKGEFI